MTRFSITRSPESATPDLSTYRVSSATVDITPPNAPESVVLQGYAAGERRAKKKLSPLYLKATLVEDALFNRVLFVGCDLFGFDEELVERVRAALEPWGIPPGRIVLNASHTHYGPGIHGDVPGALGPRNDQYAARVAEAISGLLPGLFDRLAPHSAYTVRASVRIGHSRRRTEGGEVLMRSDPEGYYHEDTPIVVFEPHGDGGRHVIVSHGCHPTGLGPVPVLFGGYPFVARAVLESREDLQQCLFLQGAGGTTWQRPAERKDRSPGGGDPVEKGRHLAEQVGRMLDGELEPVSGPIFGVRRSVDLPLERPLAREAYARRSEDPARFGVPDAFIGLHREWAARHTRGEQSTTWPLDVQLVGFGRDLVFATLSAEPSARLAPRIQEALAEFDRPHVLGYTNGLSCYLPTEDELQEGGYEVEEAKMVYGHPARLAPSTEETVLQALREMGRSEWDRDPDLARTRSDVEGGTATDVRPGSAFFTLSTGRCGTQTLARILDTASNAAVYHHPRPYLIEDTLRAYHGEIDAARTFWRGRRSLVKETWRRGLRFGETDHNMTPFAPAIAREIPDARFMILVRNPWDFVRSGMRRGYYRGHPWDAGRLRPENDHPDASRWDEMSPFEKVCWLWGETYRRALEYLDGVDDARYRVVHFEELVSEPDLAEELFEFLRLEGFEIGRIEDILSEKLNAQRNGEFPPAERWSDEFHSILWKECGDLAEVFGYQDEHRIERSAV